MINDTQIPIDDDSPLSLQSTWVEVSGPASVRKTVLLSETERRRTNVIRQANNLVTAHVSTEGWAIAKDRARDIVCVDLFPDESGSIVSTNILRSAAED